MPDEVPKIKIKKPDGSFVEMSLDEFEKLAMTNPKAVSTEIPTVSDIEEEEFSLEELAGAPVFKLALDANKVPLITVKKPDGSYVKMSLLDFEIQEANKKPEEKKVEEVVDVYERKPAVMADRKHLGAGEEEEEGPEEPEMHFGIIENAPGRGRGSVLARARRGERGAAGGVEPTTMSKVIMPKVTVVQNKITEEETGKISEAVAAAVIKQQDAENERVKKLAEEQRAQMEAMKKQQEELKAALEQAKKEQERKLEESRRAAEEREKRLQEEYKKQQEEEIRKREEAFKKQQEEERKKREEEIRKREEEEKIRLEEENRKREEEEKKKEAARLAEIAAVKQQQEELKRMMLAAEQERERKRQADALAAQKQMEEQKRAMQAAEEERARARAAEALAKQKQQEELKRVIVEQEAEQKHKADLQAIQKQQEVLKRAQEEEQKAKESARNAAKAALEEIERKRAAEAIAKAAAGKVEKKIPTAPSAIPGRNVAPQTQVVDEKLVPAVIGEDELMVVPPDEIMVVSGKNKALLKTEKEESSTLIKGAPAGKPTPLSVAGRESQISEIMKNLSFKPPQQNINRLRTIIQLFLKDIRGEAETLELLARPELEGGAGLTKLQAAEVVEKCNKANGKAEKPVIVPELKSREAKPPVVLDLELEGFAKAPVKSKAVDEFVKPALAVKKEELKPEPAATKQATPAQKIALTAAKPVEKAKITVAAAPEKTEPAASQPTMLTPEKEFKLNESSRTSMRDVTVVEPIQMGPVDEIRSFSLVDFRRLDSNAEAAGDKLRQKFVNIRQESIIMYLDALSAWRTSPIYRDYLKLVSESLVSRRTLEAVMNDKQRLQKSELLAVLELEKEIE